MKHRFSTLKSFEFQIAEVWSELEVHTVTAKQTKQKKKKSQKQLH